MTRACSVPHCGKRHYGRDFCKVHYQRWWKYGDPLGGRKTLFCSVCGNKAVARQLCGMHYQRWKNHGDPLSDRPKRAIKGEPERFLRDIVFAYDGSECLTWPFGKDGAGYGQVNIGHGKKLSVTRLVCEHAHGPVPTPEHEAAHSCGKGHLGCVSKHHLSWKTKAENEADKVIHGTSNRGERSGRAKLTEAQVHVVRSLTGLVRRDDVAAQFGISVAHVRSIQARKSWWWLADARTA